MPLGPPSTPPPAAPVGPPGASANATPASATSLPTGPSVNPASTARNDAALAGPAPIPVAPARLERDAALTAASAGAASRRSDNANAALIQARRIAAALNAGTPDFGFFWVTGLMADGTVVVANSYGLGYIPDGVHLPEHVVMATADETIPATDRGRWATHPVLAIQGWTEAHSQKLRAVIATAEQFADFDPGAVKVILNADDIPDAGLTQGRSRLDVIAPYAAARLRSVPDLDLYSLLPPPETDADGPVDRSATLWFNVIRPLMSGSTERGQAQLQALATYADHAQELALHRAHTATGADDQRAAIADWVYWQHLSVLSQDALTAGASA